ncbi:MAG TPA: hypothetical protein VN932_04555 [Rhizomicrobium sp.]|nr:hypothetical protein [Rhizomicrobium sp.]
MPATRRLRFIWADKLVLFVALSALALATFLWVLALIAAGTAGAAHLVACVGTANVVNAGAAMVALWVALRAIDFAAGGSTRKLFAAAPARILLRDAGVKYAAAVPAASPAALPTAFPV